MIGFYFQHKIGLGILKGIFDAFLAPLGHMQLAYQNYSVQSIKWILLSAIAYSSVFVLFYHIPL